MRRSKIEVYLHFVWATYQRMPLLRPEIEEVVYKCVRAEAELLGCDPLAIGGMPDHVHLLVHFSNVVSLGDLMKQIKGVSTRTIHDRFGADVFFRWQEGYGVYSVTPSQRDRVLAYVHRQTERHAAGKLWPEWEETSVERPHDG